MGMDEVDIQPPRPHQQQQPPPPPPPQPPQQQQITPTQQHPPRHPHPLQRSGGGGGGGLTLSLPLQASPSGAKIASASPPGVSLAPPANGGAAPLSANGGGGGAERGHGHRDDCWSEGATNTLIEAWGDRYLELNRGNLKQKHWKDVADAVSNRESGSKTPKTDVQCKNRLDTLKKKYKLEKTKIFGGGGGGGGTSKWPFFNKLDELIGPSRKNQQQKALVQVQVQPQIQLQVPPASSSKPLKRSLAEEPLNHRNPPQGQGQGQGSTLAPPAHFHLHHSAPPAINSASSKSDETPDTTDSYHNGIDMTVNGSKGFKKRRLPENPNPFKELTGAIIKFGEVYERVETSKLQNFIDLEKQRMEFMREMEIQRMQLFVQTQLELAKMKHGKQGNNTEHYL